MRGFFRQLFLYFFEGLKILSIGALLVACICVVFFSIRYTVEKLNETNNLWYVFGFLPAVVMTCVAMGWLATAGEDAS